MKDKIKNIWQKVVFHLSPLKKIFRICFRIARLLTIAILGSLLVYTFLMERSTLQVQSDIHEDNYRVENSNIYYDYSIEEDDLEKIQTVMNRLPKNLYDEIVDNWIILVSDETPLEAIVTHGSTMGITYYQYNVIWMHSDFDMEAFAHECGHVFDFSCGEIHRSTEFEELYYNNWDQYLEYNKSSIDSHVVSSTGEFWAEMFSEYICNPTYMYENFNDGYQYYKNIIDETWRFTVLGKYHGLCYRLIDIVNNKIYTAVQTPKTSLKFVGNNISNIFHKKINLEKYTYNNNYTFTHNESNVLFNTVLDVINNPNSYPEDITIKYDVNMPFEAYLESQSYLQIYFMDTSNSIVGIGADHDGTTVYSTMNIKKSQILLLEQNRLKYLENVENILNTMKDGNETDKLLSISEFMIDYCEYGHVLEASSAERFWDKNIGNSLTYAIVFKQFANRLNIQCDIVMSPMETGIDHYFNKVTLNDDSVKYYDLTRYSENLINVDTYDGIIYSTNMISN